MSFPLHRYRRLRLTESLRDMVRETTLSPSDFIAPLFVVPGKGVRQPVPSMPGVDRTSADLAGKDAKELFSLGVKSVILFGIPDRKDARGTSSADPEGPVCQAVRAIKAESPGTVVMTDICLCEYTDHGHCGLVEGDRVANDSTLRLLSRAAVAMVSGSARSLSCPTSRDLEIDQFWQNLHPRLQPAVPNDSTLEPGKKCASGFFSMGSMQKPVLRP